MANQLVAAPLRALDANGDPVAGARLKFFVAGTSTQVVVYSDSALTTPHDVDGIESDANGVFAPAFYGGANALKADATDDGVSLPGYPIQRIAQVVDSSSGARSVTFAPVTGNTNTNVQDAIAANTASIVSYGTQGTTGKNVFTAATAAAARTAIEYGGVDGLVEDLRAITSSAAGDLYYYNGSDLARLAKGTTGQYLRAGASAPAWETIDVESGDLTLSAGSAHTYNHGLTAAPKYLYAYLRCVTNDNGYVTGDYIYLGGSGEGTQPRGGTLWASATQIGFNFSDTIYANPKGGGNVIALTLSSWRLRVGARKL